MDLMFGSSEKCRREEGPDANAWSERLSEI